jgi:osmotically-inducible protein OsmY
VLDKEKLVGIVTRGDLVRVIATASQREQSPVADEEIRASILRRLDAESWTNAMLIDVTVNDGTVNLWGLIRSEAERRAVLVAVENIAGVKAINDQLALEPLPAWV